MPTVVSEQRETVMNRNCPYQQVYVFDGESDGPKPDPFHCEYSASRLFQRNYAFYFAQETLYRQFGVLLVCCAIYPVVKLGKGYDAYSNAFLGKMSKSLDHFLDTVHVVDSPVCIHQVPHLPKVQERP